MDRNGRYESADVAPGKYRVFAVTRPIRTIPELLEKLLLALSGAKEIDLAPKATVNVDLQPVSID